MQVTPPLKTQNLFYVQYTALMLIILTFIIGSFLQPKFLGRNESQEITSVINIKEDVILNITQSIKDFFNEIPTYSNFLREHNLKGEINLPFNSKSEDENLLALEGEIKERFKKENINLKALNVFFIEGNDDLISFKIIRTNDYDLF